MNKENKEEIRLNVCPTCGRTPHKESEYCIFHAKPEEKNVGDFKKALKKYIEEIEKSEKAKYDFEEFIFLGLINFIEEFGINTFKDANFANAVFKGSTSFVGVTFKGNTDFSGVTFKEDAYSGGHAHFWNATFEGYADFSYATFEGDAIFGHTIFKDNADFEDVTFKENADFFGITLFPRKTLSLAVKKGRSISFEETVLEEIYLELDLEKKVFINFTGTIFRNTQIKAKEINGHILQEQEKDFSEAKEIYLLLKNNFHNIERYEDERWAFKKEKDMERKSYCHFKSLHKWLWSCFLNVIFGYGEQPGKVIISAILIILGFTFIFTIFGISNTSIGGYTSKNFLDCIYFSIITFTTLGYGDFRPLEGCGRIFAGTEAFIGAIMMALFVYTFARRTGGR